MADKISSKELENTSNTNDTNTSGEPNKGDLLLSTQNTNSFVTNKAKSYSSTESADQQTELSNKSSENNSKNKVDSNSIAAESGTITKVDANAMTEEASKIDIESMSSAAGGIQNATGNIALAASSISASTVTELVAEYTTKFIALPLAVPTKITEKTAERFNKSKGDKDKNGEEYDPVKIDIGEAMKILTTSNESQSEDKSKEIDEKNKNKIIDETKEKANKVKESVTKVIDKSAKTIDEIMTHALEGAAWVQQQVDKEISRVENNVRKELDTAYKKAEDDINNFCEGEGEKIATRLIKQYNNTIMAAAKNTIDAQNKAKSKASIKSKAAIQKAKLKIFAMIGL